MKPGLYQDRHAESWNAAIDACEAALAQQVQPCLYCDRPAHPQGTLCVPCSQSLSTTGRLPEDRPHSKSAQQAQPECKCFNKKFCECTIPGEAQPEMPTRERAERLERYAMTGARRGENRHPWGIYVRRDDVLALFAPKETTAHGFRIGEKVTYYIGHCDETRHAEVVGESGVYVKLSDGQVVMPKKLKRT